MWSPEDFSQSTTATSRSPLPIPASTSCDLVGRFIKNFTSSFPEHMLLFGPAAPSKNFRRSEMATNSSLRLWKMPTCVPTSKSFVSISSAIYTVLRQGLKCGFSIRKAARPGYWLYLTLSPHWRRFRLWFISSVERISATPTYDTTHIPILPSSGIFKSACPEPPKYDSSRVHRERCATRIRHLYQSITGKEFQTESTMTRVPR